MCWLSTPQTPPNSRSSPSQATSSERCRHQWSWLPRPSTAAVGSTWGLGMSRQCLKRGAINNRSRRMWGLDERDEHDEYLTQQVSVVGLTYYYIMGYIGILWHMIGVWLCIKPYGSPWFTISGKNIRKNQLGSSPGCVAACLRPKSPVKSPRIANWPLPNTFPEESAWQHEMIYIHIHPPTVSHC